MIAPLDHRESSDCYQGELFREGKFRVAVCRDGIQWLFQRQRPGKAGVGAAWDSLGYCATRKALTRLWTATMGRVHPDLAQLPEFINRRVG